MELQMIIKAVGGGLSQGIQTKSIHIPRTVHLEMKIKDENFN